MQKCELKRWFSIRPSLNLICEKTKPIDIVNKITATTLDKPEHTVLNTTEKQVKKEGESPLFLFTIVLFGYHSFFTSEMYYNITERGFI